MNILQSYRLAAATALVFISGLALAQTNPSITDQAQSQGNANSNYVNKNWQASLRPDGVVDHVPHANTILGWQNIREADVLWQKRVWREIDTRERQNAAFRYPGDENTGGGYFIEILLDGIKRGKIKAYSTFDDRFTTAMSKESISDLLVGKADTQYSENPTTGERTMIVVHHDFNPDIVTKYRIKEDMIFDRNVGKMVVRIIGIAPLKDILNDDGSYRASQPMFWLYYPDIRQFLAQYEVFNPENDVARLNWDEFFEGRFFSSRILKVSNAFDANFTDMGMSKTEALYQGQHEAEKMFNKEHDMWVY